MNQKMDFDDILIEWGYRVHNGQPNPKNTTHLYHLSQILYENGWPYNVVEGLMHNLLEQDSEREKLMKKVIKYKDKEGNDKEITVGGALKQGEEHPAYKQAKQMTATGDEPKGDKVDEPSDFKRDTDQNKDIDPNYTRDSGDVSQDTKVALEKLNDKRFGVAAKTETSLRKGYIGQADADNMEQFQSEMGDFLREPTKEKAEALVEKYKLSQNPNGKKLYIGIIAGNGRKILGEGNALVNELSKVLNDYVPLKEKGDVQRTAQNKLQSASKPELKTVRKSDDPGVKKLFSNPPYNRLKERFHQVFGPVGEDGNLLRPSSEHSAAYFKQSVDENSSLDKTIEALKELEQQGSASPEVRKALEDHKKRMNEISKNFDTMSQEERQKQVGQSYSDMARDMHRADPDIARGLMKNMAEMALYDTELAAGDEVYLPSDGSFPSADKMRVDRDGNGVVEKVAGVSVKFGKNGGVYGFPGESAQYQKFHPDEDKRTYMRNRVGHKGHALGVRDDLVDDKDKFDKMIDESGLSKAIKNSEVIRTKFSEISKQIDEARSKIEDENGKYSIKDLVSIRKELEDLNSQMKSVLEENIDVKELENIMGRANAREFMKGASQSLNIISMASVLNTSDGLSVLEHNHQTIDKDGLSSETDKGTPNLKDWNFQFRAFDSRGGGLLCGFVGGDSPPGEI